MLSRRGTLALMLHLTLDFATPLLPGAFQLVGSCLDTVEVSQTRSWKVPAPAPAARRFRPVVPQREAMVQEARRISPTSPVIVVLMRLPLKLSSPASPASDDG